MQSPFFGIGSAVIMYWSKYSVLSLMHMKLLTSLVLVSYFFLCFAPKKVLKSLNKVSGMLPDWCKIFINVFDVENKELIITHCFILLYFACFENMLLCLLFSSEQQNGALFLKQTECVSFCASKWKWKLFLGFFTFSEKNQRLLTKSHQQDRYSL